MSKLVSGPLITYKDFADDDYLFYINSCKNHIYANSMGSFAQNIVEHYLKHVINEYAVPDTEDEENRKRDVLRTNTLRVLINYITRDMKIDIPQHLKNNLLILDGLYFTTIYPENNTVQLTVEDILQYKDIITEYKRYIESLLYELDNPPVNQMNLFE